MGLGHEVSAKGNLVAPAPSFGPAEQALGPELGLPTICTPWLHETWCSGRGSRLDSDGAKSCPGPGHGPGRDKLPTMSLARARSHCPTGVREVGRLGAGLKAQT